MSWSEAMHVIEEIWFVNVFKKARSEHLGQKIADILFFRLL